MSTKYNTKHPERSKSRYGNRLKKRGLTKAPSLQPVESLRKVQERRTEETCSLRHQHNVQDCKGVPWWSGQAGTDDEEEAA